MREDGNNVSLFFSRHFLLLIRARRYGSFTRPLTLPCDAIDEATHFPGTEISLFPFFVHLSFFSREKKTWV